MTNDWMFALPPDQAAVHGHLFSIWSGLRKGSAVPSRDDLNPGDLGIALPHCFLADQALGRQMRFRVVGRTINAAFATDMRGQSVMDLFAPKAVASLQGRLSSIFQKTSGLVEQLTYKTAAQDIVISVQLLPLLDNKSQTPLCVGAITGMDGVIPLCSLEQIASTISDAKNEPYDLSHYRKTSKPLREGPQAWQQKSTQKKGASKTRPSLKIID